jgi:hypothetical protein
MFKWEPGRIAILVWPYNIERQDTFAEDMDLLAEGDPEDRVIQKYEVEGICYGCFPHFEDHNAMERCGVPTLPFPPGVNPPEQKSKPKSNTEMEMEGDLNRPRLTEVNPTLIVDKPNQPSVPIQVKAPPAPKSNGCPHGHPHGPSFCAECNPRPVIKAGAPPAATTVAVPAQPKKIGFDPREFKGTIPGYTTEQVKLVVRYHWDDSQKSWWRDNTRSKEFFVRNFEKMADAVPISYVEPEKVGRKNGFMHPGPRIKR